MTVEQTAEPGGAATLAIFFRPAERSTEKSETSQIIDMKDKHSDDILKEFVSLTNATQVEPTSEDLDIQERLRQENEHVAHVSSRAAKLRAERNREIALLNAAQKEALASTAV
jgi:hypothetical protein